MIPFALKKTMVVLTETFAAKVRAEVRRRTEDLAEDGRFVLAPVYNMRPKVWPESICAMYEAALEYGRYRAEKKD